MSAEPYKVADISLAGAEEVAFVRSPHAHARILAIHVPASIRDRSQAAICRYGGTALRGLISGTSMWSS